MDVDSGHSQVATTDTHGIPAERLHPKAAFWRCRPIADIHCADPKLPFGSVPTLLLRLQRGAAAGSRPLRVSPMRAMACLRPASVRYARGMAVAIAKATLDLTVHFVRLMQGLQCGGGLARCVPVAIRVVREPGKAGPERPI